MTARVLLLTVSIGFLSPASASIDRRVERLERRIAELEAMIRQFHGSGTSHVGAMDSTPSRGAHHTIRKGDSYWSIARRHGISVSALEAANPGRSAKRLQLGSTINIPSKSGSTSRRDLQNRTGSSGYRVRKGDTLGHISEAHGIRLYQLLAANPGLDARRLQIGKNLVIPGQIRKTSRPAPPIPDRIPKRIEEKVSEKILVDLPPIPSVPDVPPANLSEPIEQFPAARLVVVDQNQRLFELAARHHTSVAVLNDLNDVKLSPDQMIKAGSQLIVPNR